MSPSRNVPAEPMGGLTSGERPAPITAAHLGKLAVVYVRQSSQEQVRSNTGSTEDQRALAELPVRWGWPASRVRLIDDDLGLSGTTMDRRSGFRTLLELIEQGKVGIVLVRDIARLSRDPLIAEMFLTKAIQAGILLYANGRVLDTATDDVSELFGQRIQSLLAWVENRNRAKMMAAAKVAKVRQGFAVAGPPLGYVRIAHGKWGKDPDPAVRDSVQRIFDLARESQSIGKVVRYMVEHQLQLPRRVRGEVVWDRPARSSVANILTNPNYTPDYHYRRRRHSPSPTGGRLRAEFRPASEWLISREHHEGYVSREQWKTIQDAMRARRPSVRPPLGKGPALLQGLVSCAECHKWMRTNYHRRRGAIRLPSYLCRRRSDEADKPPHHLVADAELTDTTIVRHVLAAVGATDPETAMAVIEQAQSERDATRQHRQRLLQRAETQVLAARQQYLEVGTEHQHVKADLLQVYEDAIQRRDKIKEEMGSAIEGEDIALTPKDGATITDLTRRLEALWAAPTTTVEDRKQILRLVLERVIVRTSTQDELELELVWAGGLRERLHIPRRADLDARVRQLRTAGKAPLAIVGDLRAAGVRGVAGKPVSQYVVRRSLRRVGLNRGTMRKQLFSRVRELLVAGRSRAEIMKVLDQEFPLSGRRWTHDYLYRVIRRLQQGVPGIALLPAGLLAKPDMAAVMALVEQGRKDGKAWRAIADELNTRGLRPARAERFSLFQVMELARRHRNSAGPRKLKRPRRAK